MSDDGPGIPPKPPAKAGRPATYRRPLQGEAPHPVVRITERAIIPSMGMIIFIVVATAIIIGGSVLVGRALSGGGRPPAGGGGDGSGRRLSDQEKMDMLKASGALKHRKSNR